MATSYIHLPVGSEPPSIDGKAPFKAIVVLEQTADMLWQVRISDWLVRSGCVYMVAWGKSSSSWDDSVDHASLELSSYANVPDEQLVMTTWHDAEPLADTLWFAAHAACHPSITVSETLIVDVVEYEREYQLLSAYREAQTGSA